jgi:hypothetical protein
MPPSVLSLKTRKLLLFTLLVINVVVAGCAIALFVIGEAAFAAALLAGTAFGLVGLMKLRRAFRSGSVW